MQAAAPQNQNYRQIATYFGQGATYDAIEGRFRKIKADAAQLIKEVESGERPEAPARGSGGTPRKDRAKAATPTGSPTKGVHAGRVGKTGGTSKGPKKAAAKGASAVDNTTMTPGLTGGSGMDGNGADDEWDEVGADITDAFKGRVTDFDDEGIHDEQDDDDDCQLNDVDWVDQYD